MKIYNSKILQWILSKFSTRDKLELYLILSEYEHTPNNDFIFWCRLILWDDLFGWIHECVPSATKKIAGVIPMDGPVGHVYYLNYINEDSIHNNTESH